MKSLNTLKTYVADRMRHAWQRHCRIIELSYDLEPGNDRTLASARRNADARSG